MTSVSMIDLDISPRHAYPDDHWLLYPCPWCLRRPFEQCIVPGAGIHRSPHSSRLDLIGSFLAPVPE